MLSDVRYAARRLRATPGFTCIGVLTLALGIGATTAVYSVVDALLVRPLPFTEPDRLYNLWSTPPGGGRQFVPLTLEKLLGWREQTDLFSQIEPYNTRSLVVTGAGEPEVIIGAEVGGGLMAMLGARAALGRTIQPEDTPRGGTHVVVLSDGMWRSRFGADPGVLGRRIRLDDTEFDVIGVMPAGFRFPRDRHLLWTPVAAAPRADGRPARWNVLARLAPGVSRSGAQTFVDARTTVLDRERPVRDGWRLQLRPLGEQGINPSERYALYVLSAAVGLVLLIACANLATLLLVRGASAEREIAVRAALGATRRQLVRQLMTETALVAVGGGALGVVLAAWAVRALVALTPRAITFLAVNPIQLDARVVTFALAVTLVTAATFGLLPAFRVSRPVVQDALKGSSRATGSRRHEHLRRAFVIGQLALSLMLLVGAGLLARSFLHVTRVDPGFNPRNLVAIDVAPPRWKYPTRAAQQEFFGRVLERLRALPGVQAATLSGGAPPAAGGIRFDLRFEIEGRGVVLEDPALLLPFAEVASDYFGVMGIPIVAGRTFAETDPAGSTIIVSQEMARRLWNGRNPVGERLRTDPSAEFSTVVGVAGDVYQLDHDRPHGLFATYHPLPRSGRGLPAQQTIVVRTAADPAPMMGALRREIWSVDPDQPLARMATVENLYSEFFAVPRFYAFLMAVFALTGSLIAGVGLYGIVAYATAQRTREFGIRLALGAQRRDVMALVMRGGAVLVVAGIAAGAAGAAVLARAIRSLLVEVPATDPVVYAAVVIALAVVALVACSLPARRATLTDPNVALRIE